MLCSSNFAQYLCIPPAGGPTFCLADRVKIAPLQGSLAASVFPFLFVGNWKCSETGWLLKLEDYGDGSLIRAGWALRSLSLSLTFPHIPPCFPCPTLSSPLYFPPSLILSIPLLPLSFLSSHVPCKLLALWPCLLAPQGSQTEGGSVTQLRQMGALRVASQESKHWWEGSRG